MGAVLGIEAGSERLTLNGEARVLFGIDYLGALGAEEGFAPADIADLRRFGVNCLRVSATWTAYGRDVSAVDADGDERPPYWERLVGLCDRADAAGMVVEVVVDTREGGPLAGDAACLNAAGVLAEALCPFRNVCFDLAGPWGPREGQGRSMAALRALRDRIRQVDPGRLVTAGHVGDIDPEALYGYVVTARLDLLSPHRPARPGAAAETGQKTITLRSRMKRLGKVVPVFYGGAFRRGGGGDIEPTAEDFLADMKAALAGGAAGWVFPNGPDRRAADGRPRRCCDLRAAEGRLMDQLDDEERRFLVRAGRFLRGEPD